ncbi:UNVERIFIED_CONTAM: putative sugar phosphate/phosphate translocator [Sesamum calycinum]|uniref:Sugar phosphate/phosphate translocator n=1 Tax=Sesamum calycinum TaxID=2727403 RepID=A0AAW2MAI5_9LAMI
MANPNRKWLRQEFATYTYILLYIAHSSGQIFFNKIMKVEQGMTPDIKDELWMYGCISSVVPIGAMFAMTMAREHRLPLHICCLCSNVESNHASCCFILGVLAGLEVMSCRMLLIMSVISFGVPVASYGECSLPLNPMDLPGEAEDGCTGDMELQTSRADAYVSLYFCPQSLSLSCHFAYKCFDDSCGRCCQGLGCSPTISPSFRRYKPDTYQSPWLCHRKKGKRDNAADELLESSLPSALEDRVSLSIKSSGLALPFCFLPVNVFTWELLHLTQLKCAIAGVAAYNNHKLKKEASCVSSDEPAQSIPLVSTSTSNQ